MYMFWVQRKIRFFYKIAVTVFCGVLFVCFKCGTSLYCYVETKVTFFDWNIFARNAVWLKIFLQTVVKVLYFKQGNMWKFHKTSKGNCHFKVSEFKKQIPVHLKPRKYFAGADISSAIEGGKKPSFIGFVL